MELKVIMKRLFKITSIILIDVFLSVNFCFSASMIIDNEKAQGNLSPLVNIDIRGFQDSFYYSVSKDKKPDFSLNQDDASWISFLLLFAKRSHFFSLKTRAIASLGIIEEIPEFFKKQIKAVLSGAMKECDEDVRTAAVNSLLKLIYKEELSQEECLECLLYVLENHHKYTWKEVQNTIFILGEFDTFPEKYKERIEFSLVKLADKRYSQVHAIALGLSSKLHGKGLLDFSAYDRFLSKLKNKDNEEINIRSIDSDFLTDPEYIGLNLSESVVLELFEMFEKALSEKDAEKSMSDALAVVDSLLAQNKKALALGQKRISITQDQKILTANIKTKASSLKKFYSPLEDKLELLGRTVKITKSDLSVEVFKIQQSDEDDDFFLIEASLMKNDERIKQRVSDVEVLDISVEDVRELVDDERFFEKIKIRNNQIRCIRYRPQENYLAYGEKEITQIPQDEREQFIKDFIDLSIEDIFYFLNSYAMAYIDILTIMHAPANLDEDRVGRRFSLEALPVGDIDDFKGACEHSNVRLGGLADFSPAHAQIFYKEIDVFSLWFFSRYQLFQIILKAANLAYKGRLDKEQMKRVFEFAYARYIVQLRKTMKLADLPSDKIIQSDESRKYMESIVDELAFALEVCHDDKVFSLGEDVEEKFDANKTRKFIEIRNWRWYRQDLGPYSSSFPAPSLLNLVNASVRELLKEYSQVNNQPNELGDGIAELIAYPENSDVILPQNNNDLNSSSFKMIETAI